ncbi:unnamed protein product [Prunus armeniaca]|uniref:Uncharacterized protein n=1 Tax=Prunus armeniaca TaxID=36596 RepID=A0A6J5WAL1_PRUAR|nr:unnamed protein product [Prunus armeniaca]
MATVNVDNMLTRLRQKRAIGKRRKIIVCTMISFMVTLVQWYYDNFRVKEPSHDWDEEMRSYLNRMYNGKEVDCIDQFRISKCAFKKLCRILEENGGLVRTRNISIEEYVAIFLKIIAHNLKYRVIGFDYYRSIETISQQFNKVLYAMMRISEEYIKFQPSTVGSSERSKWQWFENCLGALDGTHIPVTVSAEERPRYRNRKGDISTNVLGVCAPNLRFIYVLPGWEGSASDARILPDALRRNNRFHVARDKYYLVDAGYTNGPGFLAPYRGTRYHLSEWSGNN